MKTPHKHAALIKAWADGAEIERRLGQEWVKHKWHDIWAHDFEYRIKPEPKPDVVEYRYADCCHNGDCYTRGISPPLNLKLIFSGKDGKLIKAEVI